MSISMRDLFSRQGIRGDVISLRNSLANHVGGLQMGLREAHRRFLKPDGGEGFKRGCRRPESFQIGIDLQFKKWAKDLGGAMPSWVSVDDNETRTVEGVLTRSKIAASDFPFKPWHTNYDWNFHVRVDKQYTYLLSDVNQGDFECEWDTGFLPDWAWPHEGSRIWIVGRWIYDCGHPENGRHKTEIHPPKAVASFRSEPAKFPGNSGPTQAFNAVLYIGRRGGYIDQPINNQDYAFDLHLPPKPHPDAEPRSSVTSMTGPLPVRPRFTIISEADPKLIRVVIPLKGVTPTPDEYGAIISAGWSDPSGTEVTKIKRVRVSVEEIFMDKDLDDSNILDLQGKDEWHVHVGINGRWKIFKSMSGDSEKLDHSVVLDLHPDDRIRISASGREADEVHDLMGRETGLSWKSVEDHSKAEDVADKIRSGFLSLGASLDPGLENESISTFFVSHSPQERGSFTVASKGKDYKLRYRIETA